jgi:D-alanyl-D-alanine carboxypeptidase/D-alanyl-D-alanine-endopeptidase (penicillin-binding protein 4)
MLRRWTGFCVLAATLSVPAPAAALGPEGVRARLTRDMRTVGSAGSAYVRDLDTGRVLFSSRADVARPPASVTKLFTTSAALLRLGPDATLETELLSVAEIDADGVIDGNVWLRGGGDPTLTVQRVRTLVGRLAAQGVTKIRGSVLGDGSVFDRLPGSHRTGGRFDWDMGGALAGLAVSRGLAGGGPQSNPALTAARALSGALRRAGIDVRGKTRAGTAPSNAGIVLGTVRSPTIRRIVALTNVPSDNYYAETLLKDLGARFGDGGTTAEGALVVREAAVEFGSRPRIADGSGLSRSNRVSPRHVVRLLQGLHEHELGAAFRSTLAVAGRSGTLRYRLRSGAATGRCQAKTGTIRVVSALAGFCTARNGHTIAFAFLMSNVNVYTARVAQDRMTATLAAFDTP